MKMVRFYGAGQAGQPALGDRSNRTLVQAGKALAQLGSMRRASAVREYLVKNGGADGSRMKSVGYGEIRPIADNATNDGRFRNWRVEVLILSEWRFMETAWTRRPP